MKSFFSMGFQNGFRGDFARGFRPATAVLGQDDEILNEEIQAAQAEQPWTPPSDFEAGYIPPVTTPPKPVVPVVPTTRPPGTTDTDWAKLLADGLKAAASGYGSYTTEQIAKMKAEAEILKQKNPSVASLLPSTTNAVTIALVVGGVALLGLILVVAVKPG